MLTNKCQDQQNDQSPQGAKLLNVAEARPPEAPQHIYAPACYSSEASPLEEGGLPGGVEVQLCAEPPVGAEPPVATVEQYQV